MKVFGITGPTGAGKTTALEALTLLGAAIIDADAVYHRLTAENTSLREAIIARFGPVYGPDGLLDRKALGVRVFGDPPALAALNAITHRFVGDEIDRILAAARAEGRPAAAIDAIALIESGLAARCDAVVAVVAPAEVRIRRIMAREGIDRDYARLRVSAQHSEEWFCARCSHTLVNDGTLSREAFFTQALALFHSLLES